MPAWSWSPEQWADIEALARAWRDRRTTPRQRAIAAAKLRALALAATFTMGQPS